MACNDTLREIEIPELHRLIIDCRDEDEQRELYEELIARGLKCRVVTL